jgi:hypothetical protein
LNANEIYYDGFRSRYAQACRRFADNYGRRMAVATKASGVGPLPPIDGAYSTHIGAFVIYSRSPFSTCKRHSTSEGEELKHVGRGDVEPLL